MAFDSSAQLGVTIVSIFILAAVVDHAKLKHGSFAAFLKKSFKQILGWVFGSVVYFGGIMLVSNFFRTEQAAGDWIKTIRPASRMERALSFYDSNDLLMNLDIAIGNPLKNSCSALSHPSFCNDAIKDRTVAIQSWDSSGSGGILFGYRNSAIVATAKHVVWDELNKVTNARSIYTQDGNTLIPGIVCVSKRSLSRSGNLKYESDLAFIFAKSTSPMNLPLAKVAQKTSRIIKVGEFSGNTPNVIPATIYDVVGAEIQTYPKLWTGVSGSVVYSERGAPIGIYVAIYNAKPLGVISPLPDVNFKFLVNVLENYHCEIPDDPKKLEKAEVREYLRDLGNWVEYNTPLE